MTWPEPTRLDRDDPATWPADRVLVSQGGGQWYVAALRSGEWREDFASAGDPAGAGDLWVPLPPTPGGE